MSKRINADGKRRHEYLVFRRGSIAGDNHSCIELNGEQYRIESTVLKIPGRFYIAGEKRRFLTTVSRIRWALLTRNKAKIFYVRHKNGEIMHESVVIPECPKFPFLKRGDFEIGPCFTAEKYRGRGIYPAVLRYIAETARGGSALDDYIAKEHFVDSRCKKSGVRTVRDSL